MGRGRKKLASVEIPADRGQQIMRWNEVSNTIQQLKPEEAALRQRLVMDMFTATKLEGVETVDIGQGWRMKASKSLNVNATNENNATVNLLNAIGQWDPQLATDLIKWKPEVSMTAYRDLLKVAETDPPLRALMAQAFTVKPGMPELEMIPPATPEPPPIAPTTGTLTTDGSNIQW